MLYLLLLSIVVVKVVFIENVTASSMQSMPGDLTLLGLHSKGGGLV